jgi:hypothetical protein
VVAAGGVPGRVANIDGRQFGWGRRSRFGGLWTTSGGCGQVRQVAGQDAFAGALDDEEDEDDDLVAAEVDEEDVDDEVVDGVEVDSFLDSDFESDLASDFVADESLDAADFASARLSLR